jgi:predicted RNA-binding protein with TRAM domain
MSFAAITARTHDPAPIEGGAVTTVSISDVADNENGGLSPKSGEASPK